MNDRIPRLVGGPASRRRAGRGRGPRRLPAVEGLEGRALMSYGGGLDLTFGTGGHQDIALASTASAIQADDKIIEVGTVRGPGTSGDFSKGFVVSRSNADGTPDASFGTGGTFSDPSLGYSYNSLFDTGIASGEAVAIQPDGKIVVAGEVKTTAVVIRLDVDGKLDPSFGTGGIVRLGTQGDGTGQVSLAEGVALLPGGQVAVAGVFFAQSLGAPAVQRLDANGSVDPTFNGGGLALVPIPAGGLSFPPLFPQNGSQELPGNSVPIVMTAQADGRIIVGASVLMTGFGASQPLTEIVATRFTTAGALDPSYGTGGQAVVTPQSILPAGSTAVASTLAVQADGKLVVGGSITLGLPTTSPTGPAPQLLALRLGANGQVDPSFGVGGDFIFAGTGSSNSKAGAEAIQPDGKVVLATTGSGTPAVLRLDARGLPDAGFGVGGRSFLVNAGGHPIYGFNSLAIRTDGRIIASPGIVGGGGIVRLLGHGGVNDFDNDGLSDPAVYDTKTGQFTYYSSARGTTTTLPFGSQGVGRTLPAPGAYDGGGNSEVAIYLPAAGAFANLTPTFGYGPLTRFGTPGAGNSLPAPGDYDGSGKTEYAVYLPNVGAFVHRPASGANDVIIGFGTPGAGKSIPVPADYFGTGQADLAVYLPDQGAYAIRNPVTNQDTITRFGVVGAGRSIPVPGDYDGSGRAELAVYLPDYAELIYRPAGGGPDVVEPFGIAGAGNTLPAPGDYDGSGKTEVAAYFPTLGRFAFRPANGGPDVNFSFGVAHQSIPFVLASTTSTPTPSSPGVRGGDGGNARAASAEIPLTPDVLEPPAGPSGKKTAKHA